MEGARRGRGGRVEASRANIWDSDIVASVAFRPRKCQPNTRQASDGGGWIDEDVPSADGTKLAYRLYISSGTLAVPRPMVLMYFHANAELCTDIEMEVNLFYECGFHAVLCPEFRGFAWSSSKPRLGSVCPDATAVFEATPDILSKAGFEGAERACILVHGRSLGSVAAVHLAAVHSNRVAALVVESGVMSFLDLPMVQQLGAMMPDMLQVLRSCPCPIKTLEEMQTVRVPTLIIHGDLDEISPVDQAVSAYRACGSSAKKLARYPRAHHNDTRVVAGNAYFSEIQLIRRVASGDCPAETLHESDAPGAGLLAIFAGAFRCLPGVRRCLHVQEAIEEEVEGRSP
mmetsp:Transcript_15292/g.30057  ORF Transcript_15292/g.30057 Transcript_15292/m.30057 type:complete len:344 (+) Transcript_15292:43-1074(+)